MSLPALADLKTYLGLTGSGDDALIAQLLPIGVAIAERDTGRTFASGSNTATTYSTNGMAMIPIHDRPVDDPSRTVTWNGATLVEGTNAWFLPDRRDPHISVNLQIRPFDTSRADWYKADPQWFDKNLDNPRYPVGAPNDLVISGILGHPFPRSEVSGAILVLDAFLYWRAKSGATGAAFSITGESVSLAETPPEYQMFVRNWRVNLGVASVG
jgi:hypothetical protein